jgi:hypothetical protein
MIIHYNGGWEGCCFMWEGLQWVLGEGFVWEGCLTTTEAAVLVR